MILQITHFTYKINLIITVNNENICNFSFIDVISKVIKSKVFISIVLVSFQPGLWCLMVSKMA